MSNIDYVRHMPAGNQLSTPRRDPHIHFDPWLIVLLLALMTYGMIVLYSAVDRDLDVLLAQGSRFVAGLVLMVIIAQFHPRIYLRWAPLIYLAGLGLLVAVLVAGTSVNGSQRWLDLPLLPRFQPAEALKLGGPLMVAWYLHDRPLPPSFKDVVVSLLLALIPAALIVVQPDLGTSILVTGAGLSVVVLAGLYWRWVGYALLAAAAAAPGMWYLLQDYQRRRILTLFDPESDPLGAGWNTIQAKTALGSGGLFGKGLFAGTQSRLEFLPESQTDFIIAVIGEELGLAGIALLLVLYLAIIGRAFFLASSSASSFGRLVAGALTLTFFVYVFVNIAMVSGLLPVVGVPLPLISYGGTSAITLLAGFGIIMSAYSHRSW